MSRTKPLLKNAQRIAECKTPDLFPDPGQDLLQKLRDYRTSSVLKYSSPVKIVSKVPSKLQDKHPSSRSCRPSSSPYCEGVLYSRSGEKASHRSNKLSQDLYYQEKSVERLFKGSRILSANLVNFPEEQAEGIDLTSKTSSKDFQDYLQSIRILYPLRFDLELNFEVIQGKNLASQHNMLGDFYSLKEKIEDLMSKNPDELKDLSSGEFTGILQDYNRVIRHVLLGLKNHENHDEAAILEMIWRIIVKLLDNALVMHEQIVIDLTEKMKEKIKNVQKDARDKIRRLEAESRFQKEEFEKKIERLSDSIKALNVSIQTKDSYIHERDERMNELLEGTNRDKSCIEMTRILKKLNAYISETEDQQHKQVAALSGISHVMSLAENFDNKPESSASQVQTDLSLPDSPYPELKSPVLSKSLFYSLGPASSPVPKETLMQVLQETLSDCSGEELFVVRLGRTLVDRYSSKADIVNFLQNAGKVLTSPEGPKARLFSRLLGFPQKLLRDFELVLLKLNSCLAGVDGRTSGGLLPLFRVIELFQAILPNHQVQVQNLVSRANVLAEVPGEVKKNVWILICRFYFAFEKTKKPLKFHLETLDGKKEGFITSSVFIDWLKNKVGIWMKESEIVSLVNYFGGDLLKISNVLEKFSAAHVEKYREIMVDKEEILLMIIEDWESYQLSQIKQCSLFAASPSIQDFIEEISNSGRNLAEDNLKSCFFNLTIKRPLQKVLQTHFIIDSVGFNLEDIKKLEKKAKSKKPKLRK